MSSVHLARQGFITKATLPSVSRERGTTTVADNRTVLLLNGNGTNAAQNNTFLDASTNNFSITRNGNTTQGSYNPFTLPDGQWSNFFDGSGDFLSFTGVNSAFEFGTGDFTVECWVNPSATPADAYIWDFRPTSNNGAWPSLDMQSSKFVYVANAAVRITGTTVPVVGQWYHVAISRSGTSTRMFVNGVQEGSTYTDSTNYVVASGRPYIGTDGFGNTFPFTGYISNFRILKGTAAYTTTFTPPTANLTAITNTSLLTCQSNRFRDNSSNNFAITRNGDVRVTPWSPFAPTSAYDPATNGGSGYFDGTGDYLALTPNSSMTLDGDFTIETWIYFTALDTAERIPVNCWNTGSGWLISTQSGAWNFKSSSFTLSYSTVAPVAGTWYHLAVTRSGSSTNNVKMFINGAQVAQGTYTGTMTPASSSTGCVIGGGAGGTGQLITGYVSNLRIVKGTAVYTSAFTPPTAPVTNITNTSLLLNFTNAGIFDSAGDNVIETVGNAQIDTTIKKYGTGSLEFDGTGDWLLLPDNTEVRLGTDVFTIEMWVYRNSSGTYGLVSKGTSTTGWSVSLNSSNQVVFSFASSTITSTATVSATTWTHIAVVRTGTGTNQTTIYVGGSSSGTGTVSTDFSQTNVMYIGADRVAGSPMNGYIDDLRITKGQARYTANFTPPTSELAIVGTVPNIVNNSTYGVYQLA